MGRAEGRASVPRVGAGNRGSSAKRPQERRGLVSLLTVTMAAPSWVPTVYSLEAEAWPWPPLGPLGGFLLEVCQQGSGGRRVLWEFG